MTQENDAAPAGYSINAVHLLRTLQQINVTLSQMADQKASILMGATFVVFTIGMGQARGTGLTLPLGLLMLSSFFSAVLAALAIIPSIKAPSLRNSNLLYFGGFTQLSQADFIDRVLARLHDDESTFELMLENIYQNGQVLQHKKYRFLGYAYRVFLIGLGLTLIAFVEQYLRPLI